MIDDFLTYLRCELNYSPHTVDAYRRDLTGWRDDTTSGGRYAFDPASVTLLDLREWIFSLSKRGSSPRTVRRKVQALRAFYRWMMRSRGLQANPAAELTLPKLEKPLPVFVRPEETESVLNEEVDMTDFEQVRDRLIVDMLYTTGMRCSELTGLTDAGVDLARGELKVHGKRNKDRLIPFGKELADMIRHYQTLRNNTAGRSELFFVRSDGRPLYASSSTMWCTERCSRPLPCAAVHTCYGTRLPPTCSTTAPTSTPCADCSATNRCRPHRYIHI